MKVTVVQSHVASTKEENINHLEFLLRDPIDTDMIVLGEMWISPYQNDLFDEHAVVKGDDIFTRLQALARFQQAYLVAGSVPEREGVALYNTTFVFDPKGTLVASYRKLHLFSVTYPDGTTYREADTITKGEDIVTFDTPYGRCGLMICFDMRYPMLAQALQEQGAQILVVPGAFNSYTGPLHWHLACRSRAVDNQLFVVAVSPASSSVGDYQYYGHSLVVNPLGQVVLDRMEEESIQTIEIDLSEVTTIRETLPIVFNRRKW